MPSRTRAPRTSGLLTHGTSGLYSAQSSDRGHTQMHLFVDRAQSGCSQNTTPRHTEAQTPEPARSSFLALAAKTVLGLIVVSTVLVGVLCCCAPRALSQNTSGVSRHSTFWGSSSNAGSRDLSKALQSGHVSVAIAPSSTTGFFSSNAVKAAAVLVAVAIIVAAAVLVYVYVANRQAVVVSNSNSSKTDNSPSSSADKNSELAVPVGIIISLLFVGLGIGVAYYWYGDKMVGFVSKFKTFGKAGDDPKTTELNSEKLAIMDSADAHAIIPVLKAEILNGVALLRARNIGAYAIIADDIEQRAEAISIGECENPGERVTELQKLFERCSKALKDADNIFTFESLAKVLENLRVKYGCDSAIVGAITIVAHNTRISKMPDHQRSDTYGRIFSLCCGLLHGPTNPTVDYYDADLQGPKSYVLSEIRKIRYALEYEYNFDPILVDSMVAQALRTSTSTSVGLLEKLLLILEILHQVKESKEDHQPGQKPSQIQ